MSELPNLSESPVIAPSNGQKPTPTHTLAISLMSDGQVQVHGPLTERLLCLGLLGAATDVVNSFQRRPAAEIKSPNIIAAPADILHQLSHR